MQDRAVVLLVIAFLGLGFLGVVGAATTLRALGIDVPGELWGLGGTALGGLAGLLAHTATSPPNPPAPPAPPEV